MTKEKYGLKIIDNNKKFGKGFEISQSYVSVWGLNPREIHFSSSVMGVVLYDSIDIANDLIKFLQTQKVDAMVYNLHELKKIQTLERKEKERIASQIARMKKENLLNESLKRLKSTKKVKKSVDLNFDVNPDFSFDFKTRSNDIR